MMHWVWALRCCCGSIQRKATSITAGTGIQNKHVGDLLDLPGPASAGRRVALPALLYSLVCTLPATVVGSCGGASLRAGPRDRRSKALRGLLSGRQGEYLGHALAQPGDDLLFKPRIRRSQIVIARLGLGRANSEASVLPFGQRAGNGQALASSKMICCRILPECERQLAIRNPGQIAAARWGAHSGRTAADPRTSCAGIAENPHPNCNQAFVHKTLSD